MSLQWLEHHIMPIATIQMGMTPHIFTQNLKSNNVKRDHNVFEEVGRKWFYGRIFMFLCFISRERKLERKKYEN